MSVDEILRSAARTLEEEVRAEVDAHAALAEVEGARRRRGVARSWLPIAAALIVLSGLAALVVVAVADDDRQPVTSGEREATTTTIIDGPAPGVSDGLTIFAEPSRDLHQGDAVRIIAEGLPPGPGLVLVQMCRADALRSGAGLDACDPGGPDALQPDARGRVDGSVTVPRTLVIDDGRELVDCARDDVPCAIGLVASRAGTWELVGLVGVGFAPLEALDDPSISVTPDADLVHGQPATITGSGFGGPVIEARLCVAGTDRCVGVGLSEAGPPLEVPTDDAGGFSVEVPIWRAFPDWDQPGRIVDCAQVGCTLAVQGADGRSSEPLPIAFDATRPPPEAPTLAVTPSTGLRPGTPVTVTVSGLDEGEEVYVMACAREGAECGQSTTVGTVTGGADGQGSLTAPAIDPAAVGIDCTVEGRCAVALGGSPRGGADPLLQVTALAPVQFAP